MKIMECRHLELENTLKGLYLSDVPIVSYSGSNYWPAGFADDLGNYYLIPSIAKGLGISIDQAIDLFFGSLLAVGAMVAFFCFYSAFTHWASRVVSFIAISLLTIASFRYSDVYITFFFASATLIPLFALKKPRGALYFAIAGVLIGYCNFIRSHSGTGVLLFLFLWLILNPNLQWNKKAFYFSVLVLSCLLPYLHFHHLEQQRDRYLSKISPAYESLRVTHPKWHSIYLGLGYFPNRHGIEWSDRCAWEKALSINPNVKNCSPEYEKILRNLVFQIAKEDPIFILKTLLHKFLKIICRFLIFFNFGIAFYFYVKPQLHQVLPFFISAGFYSLSGILVMPINVYLAGMSSVATLFGLYMICVGIEKYTQKNLITQENPS